MWYAALFVCSVALADCYWEEDPQPPVATETQCQDRVRFMAAKVQTDLANMSPLWWNVRVRSFCSYWESAQ